MPRPEDEVEAGQLPLFQFDVSRVVGGVLHVITIGGGMGWRWIRGVLGMLIIPPGY